MDGKHVDVIATWFDDPIQKAVLDAENNSQLRPAVDLCIPDFWVVDLVEGSEMDG